LEEEGELLLVQNLIEFLKSESDDQNVYRAVVAIGTLVRQKFEMGVVKRSMIGKSPNVPLCR
jgi:hypothetical protein